MLRRAVVLGTILASLGAGCADGSGSRGTASGGQIPAAAPSLSLHFFGLRLADEGRGASRFALDADELVWRKRRFGIFSVAPFREIALRGARVRLEIDDVEEGARTASSLSEASHGELQVPERMSEIAAPPLPGIVTRILAEPFEIQILDGAGLRFWIRAGATRIDAGEMRLVDVIVAGRGGQRLEAPHVEWARGEDGLWVPGRFVLVADGVRHSGATAYFDLDRSGVLAPSAAGVERR